MRSGGRFVRSSHARPEVLPCHGSDSFGPATGITGKLDFGYPASLMRHCMVVSAKLIRLGCGASFCPKLYGNYDGVFVVCDYAPGMANFIGSTAFCHRQAGALFRS
ncbi:unnamed protein product [Protopolystoma xenopodis]|uniref:SCP domain-containing protein n=1 Tax=Protopolystoma xenopodis TaxID=117903 RepID=A0A3S5FH24_9PLAT|nr:unnamed protein product [Protopolystoma xenopodis]